jgi:hypothetical protein
MAVVFYIGQSANKTANRLLQKEARIHKDILQEDYIDSYYIMTSKIIGAFKWASIYCPNTYFILRINDDMVMNTRCFLGLLKYNMARARSFANLSEENDDLLFQNAQMGWHVIGGPVIRDRRSKFYIDPNDFPERVYPPYVLGSFYFITSDLASVYFNLSKYVVWRPFSVWLEDVYIGMLSLHLDVEFVQLGHYLCQYYPVANTSLREVVGGNLDRWMFVNVYSPFDFQAVWNYMSSYKDNKSNN